MSNGGMPPAGWQPDPTGRNDLRYWDGAAWTDNASTAGQQVTDPVGGPAGATATGGAATAMKYRTTPTAPTAPSVSDAPLKICPHCQAESQTVSKTCPRCGNRFHVRKRWPWVVAVVVLVLIVGGVGGLAFLGTTQDDAAKKQDAQQALHAISQQQFDAVALGTPRAGVITQLGKQPQAPIADSNGAPGDNTTAPCIYYNRTGGGFGDTYQFCFAFGVLSSKAPY